MKREPRFEPEALEDAAYGLKLPCPLPPWKEDAWLGEKEKCIEQKTQIFPYGAVTVFIYRCTEGDARIHSATYFSCKQLGGSCFWSPRRPLRTYGRW